MSRAPVRGAGITVHCRSRRRILVFNTETPAVYRRQRRNHCPHHHCHSPCHHRSRVRHHRRHPRLNDHSLPTPRTGRAHLAPSPPPPPSISKARRCRSSHPRRRHRPCHHLGRNRRRCRALRRVGGPYGPSAPSVKKKGLVTAISRAHCGVRRSSLVLWSYNNIVTLRCVADWSWFRLLKISISPPLVGVRTLYTADNSGVCVQSNARRGRSRYLHEQPHEMKITQLKRNVLERVTCRARSNPSKLRCFDRYPSLVDV